MTLSLPLDIKPRSNVLAIRSASAEARLAEARKFLEAQGRGNEVVIVGASYDAALDVTREVASAAGATFGWHRVTLGKLALSIAQRFLAADGVVAISRLGAEAVCSRAVRALLDGEGLAKWEPIALFPGLPRALARTIDELRLARVDPSSLSTHGDLGRVYTAFIDELRARKMCDRADVLRRATEQIKNRGFRHDVLDRPIVMVDVPIQTPAERELCEALFSRSPSVVITVPEGDERTIAQLSAMNARIEPRSSEGPMHALQNQLFQATFESTASALEIVSAPGESRECVEIARRIRDLAEGGTPFDAIAILLRAPFVYRAHLEEALRRAAVPAYFARGTTRPDPTGRAFLALVSCRVEDLRASRFAEYLSLGELPEATGTGEPPEPLPQADRLAPADDDLVPDAVRRASPEESEVAAAPVADPDQVSVVAGTLRTPRRWEQILVDSAVIGGADRWKKRLDGYENEVRLKKTDDDLSPAQLEGIERELAAVAALRTFALPIIKELAELPRKATWGEWIDKLSSLASRTLRNPARVLSVLAELQPMSDVGAVELREVRLVLEQRLTEVTKPPTDRRYGRVYVAAAEEARGLSFDVVFVPGLAERIFPQKVIEDPILADLPRSMIGNLVTNQDRAQKERLMLRLAVGAARKKVIASYPRLDVEASRPRTPSFYALELLRAAEGKLPGFDELAQKAASAVSTRVGWPAPDDAARAIDEAEHDLAVLSSLFRKDETQAKGAARYLLKANPYLGRALRFRAERWQKGRWRGSDGLVDPMPTALDAIHANAIGARSFSPTALQNFAACPYRFLLQAIHRLAPREEPVALEEMDALQRGSIMHETQFELLVALDAMQLLPVTHERFDRARAVLDEKMALVADRFKDSLCPAIPRVWDDAIASIKADIAEWLRRMTEETNWVPARFELSFGLAESRGQQDSHSTKAPAELASGIKLRGSIDLVERNADGAVRATDYKSGKVRADEDFVIQGGKILQPVFYALALEKLQPAPVIEGRLYYCTANGEYTTRSVPLDETARDAAALVADTIGKALQDGFFPPLPDKDECRYCDYATVCGPYEAERHKRKFAKDPRLVMLHRLREAP